MPVPSTVAKLDVKTPYEIGRIDGQQPTPSWTYQWTFPGSENPSDPDPVAEFVGPSNTRQVNIIWRIEGTYLLSCEVTTSEGCTQTVQMNVVVSAPDILLNTEITSVPSCTKQGTDYTYVATAAGSSEVQWSAVDGKFKTPVGSYVDGPYTTTVSAGSASVIVKWNTEVHGGHQQLGATGKTSIGQLASSHVLPVKPVPLSPTATITGNSTVVLGPGSKTVDVNINLDHLQDYPSTWKIKIKLFQGEQTSPLGGTSDADFGGTYWPVNGATYISYPVSETVVGSLNSYVATHTVTIPATYTEGTTVLKYRFKAVVSVESADGTCISSGLTNAHDLTVVACADEVAWGSIAEGLGPQCTSILPWGNVSFGSPTCTSTLAWGTITYSCLNGPIRFVGTPCQYVCGSPVGGIVFEGTPCVFKCSAGYALFYGTPCVYRVNCYDAEIVFEATPCVYKSTV